MKTKGKVLPKYAHADRLTRGFAGLRDWKHLHWPGAAGWQTESRQLWDCRRAWESGKGWCRRWVRPIGVDRIAMAGRVQAKYGQGGREKMPTTWVDQWAI